jgi:hypothetical protein
MDLCAKRISQNSHSGGAPKLEADSARFIEAGPDGGEGDFRETDLTKVGSSVNKGQQFFVLTACTTE